MLHSYFNLFRWIAMIFCVLAVPTHASAVETFVYKGAGCTGRDRLPEFELLLGRHVDGVVDFAADKDWDDVLNSTRWIVGCWQNRGYKLSLSIPMVPKDTSTTMENGAAGIYDSKFIELGRRLVAGGFPDAILRLGWEFNGNWYRWGSQNKPEIYVEIFRNIVKSMRTVPGQRFKFVWNFSIGLDTKLESYYPGDDVVDIIALDLYNQSWRLQDKDFITRWHNFENQPYGLNWLAKFTAEHNKVIAFPEWGTGTRPDGHGFGDDPAFIKRMADWISDHNVIFHGYWDYAAPDFNAQLSNGSKPSAAKAFKTYFGVQ